MSSASVHSEAGIAQLRTVAPRRTLPGPRAITGGVLTAVAALAAYFAAAGAAGDHGVAVVVAAHDIPAGARLTASDFSLTRMQLSPDASNHVAHSTSHFAGATTLGPIKAGELVQTGQIEMKSSGATQPEISVAIASARALGGDLRSGDRVDVIETDKTSGSVTHTAVSNAQIISVSQSSSSLGRDGDVTVRFAVASRDDATAIAAAVDQGQITLVRTTGIDSPQ